MPTGFTLGYEYMEAVAARDEILQEMEEIQDDLTDKDERLHRCEQRLIRFMKAKESAIAIRGRVFYLDPNGDLFSQPIVNPSDEAISEEELAGEVIDCESLRTCSYCRGQGFVSEGHGDLDQCGQCQGSGIITDASSVALSIHGPRLDIDETFLAVAAEAEEYIQRTMVKDLHEAIANSYGEDGFFKGSPAPAEAVTG